MVSTMDENFDRRRCHLVNLKNHYIGPSRCGSFRHELFLSENLSTLKITAIFQNSFCYIENKSLF